MIPLKDDNPTSGRPVVTYFIIGLCVLIFLLQFSSQSYRSGQLFYSYGLIPSVLMGHNQLPMDLYVVPAPANNNPPLVLSNPLVKGDLSLTTHIFSPVFPSNATS